MSRPERTRVLLVSAHSEESVPVAAALELDGLEVDRAGSAGHARALARLRAPALALIGELSSPREPLDLVREIRDCGAAGPWDAHLPTMLLAPTSGGAGVVRALESGADDFLSAGAGEAEMCARLHALLRRGAQQRGPVPTRVGELSVDPLARTCSLAGRPVALRRMEFELLAHLACEPDRVFTRGELLRAVWGFRAQGATRTVDSHACRLRRRLGQSGWVVNVRGVGYRLR